jgi:hypothetical protein
MKGKGPLNFIGLENEQVLKKAYLVDHVNICQWRKG